MKKKALLAIAISLVGLFSIPFISFAATYEFTQYVEVTTNSPTNEDHEQRLGTGLEGSLSFFTTYITTGSSYSGSVLGIEIREYTDSGYSSLANIISATSTVDNLPTDSSGTFTDAIQLQVGPCWTSSTYCDGFEFDDTRYYSFRVIRQAESVYFVNGTDAFSGFVWGSDIQSYLGGTCTDCGGLSAMGFSLSTVESSATSTSIVSLNTPMNNSTAPSSREVTFDVDYFFNSANDFGNYDEICIYINQYAGSSPQSFNPICQTIQASGAASISGIRIVPDDGLFSWHARILGTNGYSDIVSQTQYFKGYGWDASGTATSTVPVTFFPTTDDQATSTLPFNLALFNGFVTTLASKFPINWFYEFADVMFSLKDVDTATSFQPATIDFTDIDFQLDDTDYSPGEMTGQSMAEFQVFSTTTIATVAAIPGWDTLRQIMAWIVYMSGAFACYRILLRTVPRS